MRSGAAAVESVHALTEYTFECKARNADHQQSDFGDIGGRCGYGPRLLLLVISRYGKKNYVDHTVTDQSSIIAFIEDNWGLPRLPNSMDSIAGPITNMLDFSKRMGRHNSNRLFLDPSIGTVIDHDDD